MRAGRGRLAQRTRRKATVDPDLGDGSPVLVVNNADLDETLLDGAVRGGQKVRSMMPQRSTIRSLRLASQASVFF